MTTTTSERHQRIRHIGAISHTGVAVAARRAASHRREMSPGVRAALTAYAFAPGTVLKAGSDELAAADIWSLVLFGSPDAPRLVQVTAR